MLIPLALALSFPQPYKRIPLANHFPLAATTARPSWMCRQQHHQRHHNRRHHYYYHLRHRKLRYHCHLCHHFGLRVSISNHLCLGIRLRSNCVRQSNWCRRRRCRPCWNGCRCPFGCWCRCFVLSGIKYKTEYPTNTLNWLSDTRVASELQITNLMMEQSETAVNGLNFLHIFYMDAVIHLKQCFVPPGIAFIQSRPSPISICTDLTIVITSGSIMSMSAIS